MEEILASIRRIISEDDAEAPIPAAAEAAPSAAPPVAEPPPEAPREAPTRAAPPAKSTPVRPVPVEPDEPEDVLELTDTVSESGTVVPLGPPAPPPAAAPPPPAPAAKAPPPVPAAKAPQTASTAKAPTPNAKAPPEEEIELRDVTEEPPSMPDAPSRSSPPEPEPAAATRAARETDLVSQATAQAATASLAALAQAVDRQVSGAPLSVGGHSLEDLVKEIMRPMIRDWLDAHLPGLVERLVRREIERMAHHAQE